MVDFAVWMDVAEIVGVTRRQARVISGDCGRDPLVIGRAYGGDHAVIGRRRRDGQSTDQAPQGGVKRVAVLSAALGGDGRSEASGYFFFFSFLFPFEA